jgi:hypothetical protein
LRRRYGSIAAVGGETHYVDGSVAGGVGPV